MVLRSGCGGSADAAAEMANAITPKIIDLNSSSSLRSRSDDRDKVGGLEARATDKRAIYMRHAEYLRRVRALDRTSVEDANGRGLLAETLIEGRPDCSVHGSDVGCR